MKKESYLNTRGFMLVETLLVSLTIAGILIYMYSQFSTINDTYQRLYNYNTTERLYHADIMRQFLVNYTVKTDSIYTVTVNNNKAVDIKNCSFVTGNDRTYCDLLVTAMDVKKIILTYDDFKVSDRAEKILNQIAEEDRGLVKNYLKQIESVNENKYRIIVLFKDDTISSLTFAPNGG